MTHVSTEIDPRFFPDIKRTSAEQITGFFIFLLIPLPLFILSLQLAPFATHPFWSFTFSIPTSFFSWFNTAFVLFFITSNWMLWRGASLKHLKLELSLSFLALSFHALWFYCFFYVNQPLSAFILLLLLFSTLLVLGFAFWKKNRTAGIIFFPYLIWISYISILNTFFCL